MSWLLRAPTAIRVIQKVIVEEVMAVIGGPMAVVVEGARGGG